MRAGQETMDAKVNNSIRAIQEAKDIQRRVEANQEAMETSQHKMEAAKRRGKKK
jgi:hypothetical protein